MTITITQINGMPITVNAEAPTPIVLNMALPGAQGVGISNVIINELNELIVTLTNGTVLNAGVIISTGGEGVTMTPAQILAAIKTVDGLGSGLDADLLDGQNGTYYLSWNNASDKPSPIITLSGDATGSVTLANLASGTLPVTIVDNSHNHTIANVSGLQTAIDGKADDVHAHAPSDVTGLDTAITNNTTVAANTAARHAHANKTILDNTTASYTTEEQTKLAGIEAGATADQTASEILSSLKTVDGTGSELDADLLDGHDSSYFAPAATTYTKTEVDTAVGNVSIPLASAEIDGKMSASDFNKLASVEANANNYSHPIGDGNLHVPATGTSNNGKVLTAGGEAGSAGWQALTKSSVGLANVDNTADTDKPISTAQQIVLDGKANSVHNHTKSQITDFPTTLPASDVSSWAKEPTKPAYQYSEIGGTPAIPLSFRNKIINGNFDIWQRGDTQTATGYGSADRFMNVYTGTTNAISKQVFAAGQASVAGAKYYIRNVVSSVAGAGNRSYLGCRIEDVSTLNGKTATLSFYAKADSTKNIAVDFVQNFGTGGSPSGLVEAIGATKFAITSTWARYTITINIPSISGKTLGTSGNDFLQLSIWFDCGSTYSYRNNNLGQQSGTFDIAQVQLEEGSAATEFEQRPLGLEMVLCQRYTRKYATNTVPLIDTNLRATPTISGSAGNYLYDAEL